MKKVYSNNLIVCLAIAGIVISFVVVILFTYILISLGRIDIVGIIFLIVLPLLVVCFLITLSLFTLNRMGCKVLYDADERMIIRRGFICGYEYRLKVEDIKDIIIVTIPRDATYYIIIDFVNTKYDSGFKESFIRIEKNEKGKKFIKQFWNKPIKEYKENEYTDLIK